MLSLSFSESAARCLWIDLAFMLEMNHQVVKTDQADCGDSLMGSIVKMFDGPSDLIRECLLDPFPLHRCGQAEQGEVFGAASGDLANRGGHKQRRVLDHAFAHQRAMATFGQ